MRKRYNKQHPTCAEGWLERYQDAVAEERLLQARIDTLEARAKSTTRRLNELPKGDAVDMIPVLADERDSLLVKVKQSQAIKREIEAVIAKLPDDERRLLEAYYIAGMTLEAAADFVPCARRTVFELKNRALRKVAQFLE